MFIRILYSLYFVCFCLLSAANIYAGSLEDIRKKTGWHDPDHSRRTQKYIPQVTPAELVAYLDKYHRDTIRLHALFKGVTNRGLNTWIGIKENRHQWSSKRYLSFSIKDPKKKISSSNIYLFINKNNPGTDLLFELSPGTPIVIIGKVKDKAKEKVWIEVKKISSL